MEQEFFPLLTVIPGEYVAEYMEDAKLTLEQMAEKAELTQKELQGIIDGIAAVTSDTAEKLEKATGIKKRVWMNLQHQHDIRTRINAIQALKDGWHVGSGDKFDAKQLKVLADHLIGTSFHTLPFTTYVYPATGNRLVLEWREMSLELSLDTWEGSLHAPDDDEFVRFDLTQCGEWQRLHDMIQNNRLFELE